MQTEEFLKVCRFKLVEENDDVWDYCQLWEKEVVDGYCVCLERKKIIVAIKRYDNVSFDVTNENLKDVCDVEIVAQNRDKNWYSLKVSINWDELPKNYFVLEKRLFNAWAAINQE